MSCPTSDKSLLHSMDSPLVSVESMLYFFFRNFLLVVTNTFRWYGGAADKQEIIVHRRIYDKLISTLFCPIQPVFYKKHAIKS